MSWPSQLVAELTREAVALAALEGITRGEIAEAIGLTPRSLENALKPSEARAIGFGAFLELVSPDGPLPATARRAVFGRFARELGFTVVDVAEPAAGVTSSVLTVNAEAGELSACLLAATSPASPGGVEVTRDELERLRERAAGVLAAAAAVTGLAP